MARHSFVNAQKQPSKTKRNWVQYLALLIALAALAKAYHLY